MSIKSHDITIPGGTEVIVKDAVIIVQGGRVVARLDAKYDFTDLDPAFHEIVVNLLLGGRIRLGLPTEKMLRQGERYTERKAEYAALPWWRKLFTKKPWLYDE